MKVLFLNQTFYPDVMATAQYLSELAVALAERGHDVTVICSRRAYDHPERCFSNSETWRGVKIRRITTTAFGKQAKWRRAADFASFVFFCCLRLLVTSRPNVVVALTSPPLISFVGACFAWLRGAKFVYWVMDLNPDEAIAAGWLREGSTAARVLHSLSRFSFRRAQKIIALDRFMRDRIAAKGIEEVKEPIAEGDFPRRVGAHGLQETAVLGMAVGPPPQAGAGSDVEAKIVVIPPWSHDEAVRCDPAGRERFRRAHGLADKFVVMYSGNHSPCHPLDTLLDTARRLAPDPRFIFLFVGGGSEFRRIEAMVNTQDEHPVGSQRAEDGGQRPASSPESLQPFPAADPRAEAGRVVSLREGQPPSSISDLPTSLPPSSNLRCLPYQPLDQLGASLSAADLHVVVMGEPFVGVIHPCKIYNILGVGAPVLYLGPVPSHLSEILGELASQVCTTVAHGDVDHCAGEILRLAGINERGEPERYATVARKFGQPTLLPRLVAELERI